MQLAPGSPNEMRAICDAAILVLQSGGAILLTF